MIKVVIAMMVLKTRLKLKKKIQLHDFSQFYSFILSGSVIVAFPSNFAVLVV